VSLETEAQVIMGLCGLAITVTGFSGGNVIRYALEFARNNGRTRHVIKFSYAGGDVFD
jgi:hypothetical protein